MARLGTTPLREDLEERRRLTAEYVNTISDGDAEAAERAGTILRRIHTRRQALVKHAREKGIGPSPLARMWLKERLRQETKAEARSR